MKTERTRPILSGQRKGNKADQQNSRASEVSTKPKERLFPEGAIKQLFSEAAKSTSIPMSAPATGRRRRGGAGASGGFSLAALAIMRKPAEGARAKSFLRAPWETVAEELTKNRAVIRTEEDPSDAGDIIAWYFRNGYTMSEIRFRLPEYFIHESYEGIRSDHDEHAEYLRLLEMSEQEDFSQQGDSGGFHYSEPEHLSLHL